jgi:hypothetical protein
MQYENKYFKKNQSKTRQISVEDVSGNSGMTRKLPIVRKKTTQIDET